jgi:hypothetical protein
VASSIGEIVTIDESGAKIRVVRSADGGRVFIGEVVTDRAWRSRAPPTLRLARSRQRWSGVTWQRADYVTWHALDEGAVCPGFLTLLEMDARRDARLAGE